MLVDLHEAVFKHALQITAMSCPLSTWWDGTSFLLTYSRQQHQKAAVSERSPWSFRTGDCHRDVLRLLTSARLVGLKWRECYKLSMKRKQIQKTRLARCLNRMAVILNIHSLTEGSAICVWHERFEQAQKKSRKMHVTPDISLQAGDPVAFLPLPHLPQRDTEQGDWGCLRGQKDRVERGMG